MPPSPFRVHAALIAVSLLFGANFVFTKLIVAAVPASVWVLCRIAAATAILLPLASRTGWKGMPRRQLLLLGLASLLGITLNQLLFAQGLVLTTPEHSAVINACIPAWTLLVAVLCRQERWNGRRGLALLLALCGVWYLLGLDRLLTAGEPLDRDVMLGDLLTVANSVSFAVHLVLLRRIGRGGNPWQNTAVMFLWAVLTVSVWTGPDLTAAHLQALATPPLLWFAGYAILFATVLTYCLNTWALQHVHSSQVALYINLQPIVAVAVKLMLGMPAPGGRFFVALLLVFAGLWLQTRAR